MVTKKTETPAQGFDIASTTISQTARITLFHPVNDVPIVDNDGAEMFVEVYGQDSDEYQKILRLQKNKMIHKAARSNRLSLTAEMQEENALLLLCACIKDWNVLFGGAVPEVNAENARKIFAEAPWVKEQVDAGIHDRRNFMRA